MKSLITCTSIGVYSGALSRGKQYEVVEEDTNKVRVRGDNQRTRWFPKYCFDLEGRPAPVMFEWKFDERISDEKNDWVEVSFRLIDGTQRWCSFVTPDRLKSLLEQPFAEAGFCSHHMVIVASLSTENVERMLKELDQNGELIQSSLPLNEDTDGDEKSD